MDRRLQLVGLIAGQEKQLRASRHGVELQIRIHPLDLEEITGAKPEAVKKLLNMRTVFDCGVRRGQPVVETCS